MTPSKLIVASLLLFPAVVPCRANLDDTEAQCITRYGPESDVTTDIGYRQVGDKAASFTYKTSKVAMFIRVTFLRGLSCHESISNVDAGAGLTEDQMKAILDSQGAGLKWRKGKTIFQTDRSLKTTNGTVDWLRSDGATARFWLAGEADARTHTGTIDLSTKLYTDAQRIYDKENGD